MDVACRLFDGAQGRQLELLRDTHSRLLHSARSPVRSPEATGVRVDTLRTIAHLKDLAAHGPH
jgi:hypothetical protein